jgi:hypothetical protein
VIRIATPYLFTKVSFANQKDREKVPTALADSLESKGIKNAVDERKLSTAAKLLVQVNITWLAQDTLLLRSRSGLPRAHDTWQKKT